MRTHDPDAIARVEALVLEDFRQIEGRLIEASELYGYRDGDLQELSFEIPVLLQVTETPKGDLQHWIDEWCDPYYNVALVDDRGQSVNATSLWVYGRSHSTEGKVEEPRWTPVEGAAATRPVGRSTASPGGRGSLFCCETGVVACAAHAPAVDSERWAAEVWRPTNTEDEARWAFLAGRPLGCEYCPGAATRAA